MKGLKNYNLKFERIKIWNTHIKTKCVPGVIGDSRWLKYHPKITRLHVGCSGRLHLIYIHPKTQVITLVTALLASSNPGTGRCLGMGSPPNWSCSCYICLPKGRHSEGPHEIDLIIAPKMFWGGVSHELHTRCYSYLSQMQNDDNHCCRFIVLYCLNCCLFKVLFGVEFSTLGQNIIYIPSYLFFSETKSLISTRNAERLRVGWGR